MKQELIAKIAADPAYHHLVKVRSKFGWQLTWSMFAVYYGFILLIAFNKELLSAKTGAGVTTWGIPIGLFVIVFTVFITGIYVRRANGEFDRLTAEINARAQA